MKFSTLLLFSLSIGLTLANQYKQLHLADLPFEYDALEPYISAEIMKIHHSVHHQNYVDRFNKLLSQLRESFHDFEKSASIGRLLNCNLCANINHNFFWSVLGSEGTGKPHGSLASHIKAEFGSYEDLVDDIIDAGLDLPGSGWVWLAYNKNQHVLQIVTTNNQDCLNSVSNLLVPILAIDVWEHAYYLQYKSSKAEYLKNIFHVINWKNVEEHYKKASASAPAHRKHHEYSEEHSSHHGENYSESDSEEHHSSLDGEYHKDNHHSGHHEKHHKGKHHSDHHVEHYKDKHHSGHHEKKHKGKHHSDHHEKNHKGKHHSGHHVEHQKGRHHSSHGEDKEDNHHSGYHGKHQKEKNHLSRAGEHHIDRHHEKSHSSANEKCKPVVIYRDSNDNHHEEKDKHHKAHHDLNKNKHHGKHHDKDHEIKGKHHKAHHDLNKNKHHGKHHDKHNKQHHNDESHSEETSYETSATEDLNDEDHAEVVEDAEETPEVAQETPEVAQESNDETPEVQTEETPEAQAEEQTEVENVLAIENQIEEQEKTEDEQNKLVKKLSSRKLMQYLKNNQETESDK